MGAKPASQKLIIYILRRDLRLADNPVFHELCRTYSSQTNTFTHILPLYVFPAHQVEISGFIPEASEAAATPKSPYQEARSQVGGFWRCGPHRAKFLAESVWDLKQSLEKAGNGLVIRAGVVEDIISTTIDGLEAKPEVDSTGKESSEERDVDVVGVWMAADEGFEEKQEQEKVRQAVEKRGKEFRLFQDEKFFVDEYVFHFMDAVTMPYYSLLTSHTAEIYLSNPSTSCLTSTRPFGNHLSHYGNVLVRHFPVLPSFHHCCQRHWCLPSHLPLLSQIP